MWCEFRLKCSLWFPGRITVSDERSMFLGPSDRPHRLRRLWEGRKVADISLFEPCLFWFVLFGWRAMDVAKDLYSISFQESGMLLGMKMPGCTLRWAQCCFVFPLANLGSKLGKESGILRNNTSIYNIYIYIDASQRWLFGYDIFVQWVHLCCWNSVSLPARARLSVFPQTSTPSGFWPSRKTWFERMLSFWCLLFGCGVAR